VSEIGEATVTAFRTWVNTWADHFIPGLIFL